MQRRVLIILVGIGLILGASVIAWQWLQPPVVPRANGPIPHQAYIWQRLHNGFVEQAIERHGEAFERLVVLAAEVSWRDGRPDVVRIDLQNESLLAHARPIGLAIRINAYAGPFDASDAIGRSLAALAKSVIADARAAGLEPAELQIDFDAATAKLAGYQQWLDAIRPEVAALPLTITALPTWLDRGAFTSLARSTDGFVLQVHSLNKPEHIGDPVALCPADRVQPWVEQAARVGVPFRLSLPTYGYVLAYDVEGRYLGLSAEQSLPNWPAGTQLRVVRADPDKLARIIEAIEGDRPMNLQSVCWFRLPTASDWLNWHWPTLGAVMAGRPPRRDCRVATSMTTGPELQTVWWTNRGEADAPLDVAVSIEAIDANASIFDVDGQGGYTWRRTRLGAGVFEPSARLEQAVVKPGQTHPIGWIRFDRGTEVTTHVRESTQQ